MTWQAGSSQVGGWPATSWQAGFVAVSALLGEPADARAAAMSSCGEAAGGEAAGSARWLGDLASMTRGERARAIASAVSAVAVAVEQLRFV